MVSETMARALPVNKPPAINGAFASRGQQRRESAQKPVPFRSQFSSLNRGAKFAQSARKTAKTCSFFEYNVH
jgi:hypothetical protein